MLLGIPKSWDLFNAYLSARAAVWKAIWPGVKEPVRMISARLIWEKATPDGCMERTRPPIDKVSMLVN